MAKKPLTRDELMRLAKKAAAENGDLRTMLRRARSMIWSLKGGIGDRPGQVRPSAVHEMLDEIDEIAPDPMPIIQARIVGTGPEARAVFDCPICKSEHQHSPEPGYRVAHCHDRGRGTPFENGYILELEPAREGE